MSTKFFCDVCKAELDPESDLKRVKRKLGDVEVEIMHAYKGVWNSGHVCPGCIINVVASGEPSLGLNEDR
ncbi:hypothetical protein [Bradyrhizobium tunisiense]|uniref:hypothetical protein n=1 Tax=Bradyrhizobium tunisiense TaxID=3278709 RepID=UPI0035DCE3E6